MRPDFSSKINNINVSGWAKIVLLVGFFLFISARGWGQTADFSASNTSVCMGSSVEFTDNSSITGTVSYTWNFGAGSLPSSATGVGPHTVTYTMSGTVTISLTVTDDVGTDIETKEDYISVNALPTVASIADGALSVCEGSSTPAFTNATVGGTWSIVSGTGTASITTGGVATGLTAGTVTVTYTVTNTCGETSATQTLTVNALPTAPVTTVTQPDCATATGTITVTVQTAGETYSFDNGSTFQPGNSKSGLSAGSYEVIIKSAGGCSSVATSTDVNASPSTPTAPVTTVTQPDCATATGTITVTVQTAGETYSFDNGSTFQPGNSKSGLSAGSYEVIIKSAGGCSSVATSTDVNASPSTPTAPVTTVTQPDCATATGTITVTVQTAGETYSFDNGSTFQPGNSKSGLSAGSYEVIIKSAGGCSSVATSTDVNASPSTPTAPVTTVTQPDCATATGTITVTVQTAGETYSFDNGSTFQPGNSKSGLSAGSYEVIIKSAGGCSSVATSTDVNASPSTPTAPVTTVTQPDCATATGTITVTVQTAGETYSFDNGSTFQPGNSKSGLSAGSYEVIIKSAGGCSSVATSTDVNASPSTPTAPVTTVTQPDCATATGTITVTVQTAGETYSFDNGSTFQPGNSKSGLSAGSYEVIIKSAGGCSSVATSTDVNASPSTPTAPVTTVTQPDCATATGTITVTVQTAGETYSFDNGSTFQPGNSKSGLSAGSYEVIIKSAGGCSSVATSTDVNASPSTPTAPVTTVTQPDCATATGTITVTVQTAGETYSFDNGSTFQPGNSKSGLSAGSYEVIIKSAGGCSSVATSTDVNASPSTPTAPVTTVTQPDCATATGTITVTVQTAGETYSFDNGSTFQPGNSKSGLSAGSYEVIIKSAGGCSSVATSTDVNASPSTPTAPVTTVTQPDCATATGTITVTVQTAGETYSFDNGSTFQPGNSKSGLSAGSYEVIIKSAGGCSSVATSTDVNASPSTPTAPVTTVTQPDCATATGTITVTVQTAGETYSFDNGSTFQPGNSKSGLSAGSYEVIIKSAGGCSSVATSTDVNASPSTPTAPVTTVTQPDCATATGTITVTVQTAGETYSFDNGSTFQPGNSKSGLSAGSYEVIIKSAGGCSSVATSTDVNASPSTPTAPVTTVTQPDCATATGTITVTVQTAGETYSFDNGSTFQPGNSKSGLSAGSYEVIIKSAGGCSSVATSTDVNASPSTPTAPVTTVTQPDCATATGTITVTVQTAGETYSFDNGSTFQPGNSKSGLSAGSYEVIIKSAGGCSSVATSTDVNASPSTPTAPVTTVTQPDCATATGTITVTVQTAGETYSFDNGSTFQPGNSKSGLSAGSYEVIIKSAGGCSSVATSTDVNASPSTPTAPVTTVTQPDCATATGTITVTVQTAGETYSFDNGSTFQPGNSKSGLSAGSYEVIIKSAGGCSSVATSTDVNASPSTPTAPVTTVTQPDCATATGTITVTVQTAGETYSFDNGSTFQPGNSKSGLSAGSYEVIIKSAGGCSSVATSTDVNASPSTPTAPVTTVTQPDCATATGTITVTVQTAGETYSFDNGSTFQPGNSKSGLSAGSYEVIIKSAGGCSSVATSTDVNASPSTPTAPVTTVTQPDCATATGTITVTVQTAGETYSFDNGSTFQPGNSKSGLSAGSYEVIIKSAGGCSSVATSTDVNASPSTPTAPVTTVTQPDCATATGTITVTVQTAGETYSFDNGSTFQPGNSKSGLSAGSYEVIIKSAGGCSSVATSTDVNASPSTPTAPVTTVTQPDCATATGTITVTVQTAGETYSFDNGSTFQPGNSKSGLSAGSYEVIIKSAGGCSSVATSTDVNASPSTPTAPVTTVTQPDCATATGTITVTVQTAGETYSFDNGSTFQPGNSKSGLSAGSYEVIIKSAGGCSSVATSTDVNASPSTPTAPVTTVTQPDCATATGTITVTVQTAGETYSFDNGSTFQPGNSKSGLSAGSYEVIIKSAGGCSSVATSTDVNASPSTPTAPVTTVTQPDCATATGTITVTVQTAGETYSFDNGSTFQPGNSKSGLSAGSYEVIIKSAGGCSSVATSTDVNASPSTPTAPVTTVTQPDCATATGTITVTVQTAGETYSFDNGSTFQPGNSKSGLSAGSYEVIIKSAGGCSSVATSTDVNASPSTPTVSITNPAAVCSPSTVNITMTAITAGSTAGLTYTYWTNSGATIAYGSPTTATAGTYYIKGTTAPGCFDIKPVTVTVNPTPTVSIINPAAVCSPSTVDITLAAVTAGSTPGLTYSYWTNSGATIAYGSPTTATAGTYYIKGTTPEDCFDIKPVTVTTLTPPATSAITGVNNPACSGTGAVYSVTLIPGSSYLWTVPSGSTITSGATGPDNNQITVSFGTTNGNITVTETNAASCTGNTQSLAISLAGCGLSADFTGSPLSICTGSSVTFTNTSTGTSGSTTYSWNFGSGASPTTATGAGPHVVTYSIPGSSTVSLTITEGASNTKTQTNYITVNSIPTVSITNPAAVCSPSTVDITLTAITAGSTPGLTYTYWTNSGATIAYGSPTTATAGTYYIKGTTAPGCFEIKPVTVTVNPTPTVSITNPASVCSPSTVDLTVAAVTAGSTPGLTYTYWTDAAATISYGSQTAATAGTYYIKGTTSAGCFDIRPVTVTVNPTPAITITTPATCATDLLSYSAGVTVSSGTVTCGTGTVTNLGGNVWSITGVPKVTNITIIVTDANSCTNSISITAPDCSCPVISAPVSGGDKAYCSGSPIPAITASVSAGETVDWFAGPAGGTALLANSTSYTPLSAGTYYAEARNIASGCISSNRTSIILIVNTLPIPVITGPAAANVNSTGNLYSTAAGMTNYTWVVSAGGLITSGGGSGNNTVTVTWNTYGAKTVSVNYTNSSSCTAANPTIYNVIVNAAPVVGDIPNQIVPEGGTFTTINLDNYVSDPDNPDAEISWTYSGNSQLTVTIVNRVATIGIPNIDWNGVETLSFIAKDPGNLSGSDLANFTVSAVNDIPVFSKGLDQTVTEDVGLQTVSGWATGITDGDPEVSQLLNFIVTNDNNGLFASQPSVSPTGTLTYTPALNQFGNATVTVVLNDNGGTSNGGIDHTISQFFNITVLSVNDAPAFFIGSNQIVPEDAGAQTVNGWASASPGPPNELGQTFTFFVSNTNNGLFSVQPAISPTGTLTYTPSANSNGNAIVSVYLQDSGGTANGGTDQSGMQTFTLTVTSVNDPPVLNFIGNKTVDERSALSFIATANDSDVPPDLLTYSLVGAPTGASINASTGEFTWTPDETQGPNTYTFTVKVIDNGTPILSDEEEITVTVYVNQPVADFTAIPNPASCNQNIVFDAGSSSHGRPDRSIVNYEWTFGDGQTGTGITTSHAFDHYGFFNVVLTITDNNVPAQTATKSLNISVSQGNVPPVANTGGSYTVDQLSSIALDGSGSSDANESCGDRIVVFNWLIGGTIALSGETPSLTSVQLQTLGLGDHPISLRVTDSFGADGTSSGTLHIVDQTPPTPPSAPDLQSTSDSGISDSDNLTHFNTPTFDISGVESGSTVTVYGNGLVLGTFVVLTGQSSGSFTPASPMNDGTYTITATQTDLSHNTSVMSAPMVPSLFIDTNVPVITLLGDNPLIINYGTAYNEPGATVTEGLTATISGSVNIFATGVYSIMYNAVDLAGNNASQVTRTVHVVNNAPVITEGAGPLAVTCDEDNSPDAFILTLHASDIEGNIITWSIITPASHGVASASGTGTSKIINYVPTSDYYGSDSFVVRISDGFGGIDNITVDVTIDAVNDVPVFTKGPDQTIPEDAGAQTVNGWATSIGVGPANEIGQILTFTVSNTNNALFSVQPSISSTGVLTYMPSANSNGSAIVSVYLKDNGGTANGGVDQSSIQTFNINVTAVNDAPLLNLIGNKSICQLSLLTFNATSSDIDIPANNLTYTLVNPPSGAVIGSASGVFTWTPDATQSGTFVFSIRVTDNGSPSLSDEEEITVTVNPLPSVSPILGGASTVNIGESTPPFTDATPGGTWSIVSGTGSASITSGGIVTGLTAGTVNVNYTITNLCGVAFATHILNVNVLSGISFIPGWNWFSVNTTLSDMTLGNVLSAVNTNGDYIKNQVSSATYYTGFGWFGTLTVIDPTKLYKIKVQNSVNITLSGIPSDCSTTSIGLVTGWNWIGYLPQSSSSINEALSSLSLSNLDYIKNQTKSATYYTGFGWFGSLTDLSPDEGYMMKLAGPGTLIYPDVHSKKGAEIFVETEEPLFSPATYENNGSVTASVYMDGVLAGSKNDRIFAYVNNEIRGVAFSQYFDILGTYLFPVMVHSNLSEGEVITFKYYDAEKDRLYPCNETLTFVKDMVVSDAFKPFALNVNLSDVKNDKEELPHELLLRTYPNPFDQLLNIEYTITEQTHVRLIVYDLSGRIIKILLDKEQMPDIYSVQWDSSVLSAGMYIVKLQTRNKQIVKKVILTRKNT